MYLGCIKSWFFKWSHHFFRSVMFLSFAMQINHRVDAFWAWLCEAEEYVIPAHLRVWRPGQLHICLGSGPGSVRFPDSPALWLPDPLTFRLSCPGPVRAQVLQFPVSYVVLGLLHGVLPCDNTAIHHYFLVGDARFSFSSNERVPLVFPGPLLRFSPVSFDVLASQVVKTSNKTKCHSG